MNRSRLRKEPSVERGTREGAEKSTTGMVSLPVVFLFRTQKNTVDKRQLS